MPDKPQITIHKAGPLTTVQGGHRIGYMEYGLGRSGAMDQQSSVISNRLLGNADDTALLETTFQGLSIQFHEQCIIAITGGDLGIELNGRQIEMYKAIPIKPDDYLVFKKRKSGFRAYLAIHGGIRSPEIMGSHSTHSMYEFGNVRLRDGSALYFNTKKDKLNPEVIKKGAIPVFSSHFTARIVPGPEFDQFSKQITEQLSRESFTVSSDSNRMGYRLQGTLDGLLVPEGIVSSGIVPGTIQITSSGQPIILMNDGPTTGGYARIGNVITPDLSHIAQLGPGDSMRFRWIDFGEANRLLKNHDQQLKDMLI